MSDRRSFLEAMGLVTLGGLTTVPVATAATSRADFLLDPGIVYLNTGSLGPSSRVVIERTIDAWRLVERNPVAMAYGQGAAHVATDTVRTQAGTLLGCTADELLITRSTTEAMNDLALALAFSPGDRILTTDQEHEGGTLCWQYVARRHGVAIDVVTITPSDHDPGVVLDRLAAAFTPSTRVVSVSHVVTTTGLLLPVREIATLAHAKGALCVVNGAQAIGQIPVDVRAIECDAYAASGHKWLLGPKGTGLSYVSPAAEARLPLIQREAGRRFVANSTGIGSLPLAVGLGAAIAALQTHGMAQVQRHNMALRDRAYQGLSAIAGVALASPPPGGAGTALVAARLPDSRPSDVVRDRLRERHGVIVKMVEKRWFNGIRLSPHVFNTEADVDTALDALRAALA